MSEREQETVHEEEIFVKALFFDIDGTLLSEIMELQKNTKSGKLFSYLGGGSDEAVKNKGNNEKKEPAMQEQR